MKTMILMPPLLLMLLMMMTRVISINETMMTLKIAVLYLLDNDDVVDVCEGYKCIDG